MQRLQSNGVTKGRRKDLFGGRRVDGRRDSKRLMVILQLIEMAIFGVSLSKPHWRTPSDSQVMNIDSFLRQQMMKLPTAATLKTC